MSDLANVSNVNFLVHLHKILRIFHTGVAGTCGSAAATVPGSVRSNRIATKLYKLPGPLPAAAALKATPPFSLSCDIIVRWGPKPASCHSFFPFPVSFMERCFRA